MLEQPIIDEPLQSYVRVDVVDDQHVITRKYYREDTGRIRCKYALTIDGRWLLVEEGQATPKECYLNLHY